MKTKTLLIAAFALLSMHASYAGIDDPVSGKVKDTKGRPVVNAVVSDGYSVTTTNGDGEYSFPRTPAASYVWVSIPSGYEIPLRQGHPCFYEKLVDNVASYDFTLTPITFREKNFTLFLIADPQCQNIHHVDRLRTEAIPDLKAYSKKQWGSCYAVTLGDIGYTEGYRNTNYLLPIIREEMASDKTGMPVFQTVGNHDFEYYAGALDDLNKTPSIRRDRMFEAVFGPIDYSWNRGDCHIISMNDVIFNDMVKPGSYHGGFTDEQVSWLRQDLEHVSKDKLVILCVHIPFEGMVSKDANAALVHEMIGAYKNNLIVSGHTHTIKKLGYQNGVRELVCGAMSGCWWWSKNCADGAPNGYMVVHIKGNKVTDDFYKAQNFKDDYQMRVYRGDAEFGGTYERFKLEHGHNTILINAWNADQNWKIEVFEDGQPGGSAELMEISSEFTAPYNGSKDWWAIGYNVGVVGRGHAKGSTRNNYCSKCYHMYKYTLKNPECAEIKVVATDPTGRKFTTTKVIEGPEYAELATPPSYNSGQGWTL